MKPNTLPIRFRLSQIREHQFSTFEIDGLNKEKKIAEKVGFRFGADIKSKQIVCDIQYQLEIEDKPFIKIIAGCVFKIEPRDWKKIFFEDKITLPPGLAQHFATISSGTARGILFANTRGTTFNNFPMSLLDVTSIIKKEIILNTGSE